MAKAAGGGRSCPELRECSGAGGAEFVQGDAGGLHTQFAGLSEEILGSLHS